MSAVAASPPAGAHAPKQGMSQLKKVVYSVAGVWIGGIVLFIILFGFKSHKAPAVASSVFSPTDEFKLDTWFKLGPIAFNKGVLYLLIAAAITIGVMLYIARRLQQRPGRLQVAVEAFYSFTRGMSKENLDEDMQRKYFPLIATIFVFILVTNLIGYIPLPINSGESFKLFGASIPSFQIFAADTNVGFPLILALGVFILFTYEGVRPQPGRIHQKPDAGRHQRPDRGPDLPDRDLLSNFLRLISLTVRLWANLLAGHMLIAFMGGELGVLVGDQWVEWLLLPFGIAIYLFEAVLIAGLQAFIFSILTAICIGGAVESH